MIDATYLVPVRPGAAGIAAAVASARAQEGVAVEAILVLPPGAPAVDLADAPALGPEEAARAARGRRIGVLDPDETLAPGRTRLLVDLAEAMGADAVADNAVLADAAGRPLGPAFPAGASPYVVAATAARALDEAAGAGARLAAGAPSPLLRAETAARIGLADALARGEGAGFLVFVEALLSGADGLVLSTPGRTAVLRPATAERAAAFRAGLDAALSRRVARVDAPTAAAAARLRAALDRTLAPSRGGFLRPLLARYRADAAASRPSAS